MQSSPLEIANQVHIENEFDFIDFCETNQVPKKIDLHYRKLKDELIDALLLEVSRMKKMIGKKKIISEISMKPNSSLIDHERSIISHELGENNWYQFQDHYKKEKFFLLIDNSASMSFARRLDIARSLAILLSSFHSLPQMKVLLFAENIKEIDLDKVKLSEFLRDYLSIKSNGFTDFNRALTKFSQYLNRQGGKGLIISDGVSSVGTKQIGLNFPAGRVHYIKLGSKSTEIDQKLKNALYQSRGQVLELKPQMSLLKPLYQIIKRL